MSTKFCNLLCRRANQPFIALQSLSKLNAFLLVQNDIGPNPSSTGMDIGLCLYIGNALGSR